MYEFAAQAREDLLKVFLVRIACVVNSAVDQVMSMEFLDPDHWLEAVRFCPCCQNNLI